MLSGSVHNQFVLMYSYAVRWVPLALTYLLLLLSLNSLSIFDILSGVVIQGVTESC